MEHRETQNYTDVPVYRHDATFAREHEELPQYRASYRANIACKEAVEQAIRDCYDGSTLDVDSVLTAVKADFSMERIQYVLANTVRAKDFDERFSRENKEWAQSVPVIPNLDAWGIDRNCYFVVDQSHSILTDAFVTHFRREMAKEPMKKPSVLAKMKAPIAPPDGMQPKQKTPEL